MPLLSSSIYQLLLAFVSASILHKLTYQYAFLKWLTSRKLVCYLSPSDHDLRNLRPVKKANSEHVTFSKKRYKKYHKDGETKVFSVRTSDLDKLKLERVPIRSADLELLPCSLDLEWIVDLAMMSIFNYILTEIQFYYYPTSTGSQCNFSLFWACLVIICSIKTLCKFTWLYFRMQQLMGERSVCIISSGVFLVISMLLLIVDENKLEFGIEAAYSSFNASATKYVKDHILSSHGYPTRPVSLILVKFSLAIWCTIIGALFTFPGLRFGQMQGGLIEKHEKRPIAQFMYHVNYLNSLIVTLLWIKPLTRDLLTDPNRTAYIISNENFDTFRIYFMIQACLFRFFLLPAYLNTYLKLVESKIATMKKFEDTMSNTSIQEMVAHIYTYVNVVAIQYVIPIFMCLFSAIIFKNLGGYSWIPQQAYQQTNETYLTNQSVASNVSSMVVGLDEEPVQSSVGQESITPSKYSIFGSDFTVDFDEFKSIFSTEVFRGLLGFCNWWLHFVWFCTSSVGLVYYTKFSPHA